jgi:hypothetical protein
VTDENDRRLGAVDGSGHNVCKCLDVSPIRPTLPGKIDGIYRMTRIA